MSKARKVLVLGLGLILLSPMLLMAKTEAAAAKTTAAVKAATTLENLNTAYDNEMNTQAKYLVYSDKAKAEGYLRVAKLFRGIARSEGMHADSHAKVIKALGGTAVAKIVKVKAGTTKENLNVAIAAETNDVEKMYPEFIKQAQAEKIENAVKSFGGAKVVEGNHQKLLVEAAAKLADWKADGDIFICKVCGNVVTKLDFEYCPVCKAPVSEFDKVM